jgi:5-methylcytosine-specific restriction enzyme A
MGANDKWYDTAAWARRRKHQLMTQPLCVMCAANGKITPATVADHIEPHRGDFNKFVLGRLQSLCRDCHNSRKQRGETKKQHAEAVGYSNDFGVDGWPVDPRHPSYQRR